MENEKKEKLKKRKLQIAAKFDTLNKDYKKTHFQSELKIFGSLVDSFSTISSNITLEKALRPFQIGLKLALIGIEKEKSSAGILGKNLLQLHQFLNVFLTKTFLKNDQIGKKNLFDLFLKSFLVVLPAFIFILKEKKLTSHEKIKDDPNWSIFEFELLLLMIFNTDSIKTIYDNFASALNFDENLKHIFINALNSLTFLFSLHFFSKDNQAVQKMIFSDLKEYLIKSLKDIEKCVEINTEENSQFNIQIKKLIICLESDDFDNFYNTIKEILILIQINPEMYYNELYDIDVFTKSLLDSLNKDYGPITTALHTV